MRADHIKFKQFQEGNFNNRKVPVCSCKELCNFPGVPDCCRKPYPLELSRDFDKPFKPNSQLGSAFRACKFVDLIDNNMGYSFKVLPQAGACKHCLKSLRCCNQHVRRISGLTLPLTLRGVPMPDLNLNVKHLPQIFNAGKHITVKRAERSNIKGGNSSASFRLLFEDAVKNRKNR
ncbi:hypothetical protein DSECCO2_595580 [anaerobic digester metagenome]